MIVTVEVRCITQGYDGSGHREVSLHSVLDANDTSFALGPLIPRMLSQAWADAEASEVEASEKKEKEDTNGTAATGKGKDVDF